MAYLSNSHTSCRPAPTTKTSLMDLLALYRQRRALARLDAASLQDIGLSHDEAQIEAHRRPWDVPASWRK
ncbi:DUF1127 domain-containing protein [Roseovarius litorisediminis]|uniref:DUF1127 domain-containing protein n=1 Tax=Roseovarius litorisediminis TaxID=1312363 RepID=UPI000A271B97|nr:DUF1127 domain-containing protein [Roseovarius litorisediminis]